MPLVEIIKTSWVCTLRVLAWVVNGRWWQPGRIVGCWGIVDYLPGFTSLAISVISTGIPNISGADHCRLLRVIHRRWFRGVLGVQWHRVLGGLSAEIDLTAFIWTIFLVAVVVARPVHV